MTATRYLNNCTWNTIIRDKLIPVPQPVSVVTFYRSEICDTFPMTLCNAKWFLWRKSRMIRFVQCNFRVMVCWFPYPRSADQYHAGMEAGEMGEKLWCLDLKHPLGIMTEETVKALELNEHISYRKYIEWVLGEEAADFRLIWPYPEEQLQWLEASLDKLWESATPELKSLIQSWYQTYSSNRYYEIFGMAYSFIQYTKIPTRLPLSKFPLVFPCLLFFVFCRQDTICLKNECELPKMNLKWDGRDLDILDCAFFVRLLSSTLGGTKPPYQLSDVLIEL